MHNLAYDRLRARFARIAALGEAASMLHWDAAAMMPPGGAEARGEQLAALAGLAHELLTAPVVAGVIGRRILRLTELPKPADAADALALAITHVWRGSAHHRLEAAAASEGGSSRSIDRASVRA